MKTNRLFFLMSHISPSEKPVDSFKIRMEANHVYMNGGKTTRDHRAVSLHTVIPHFLAVTPSILPGSQSLHSSQRRGPLLLDGFHSSPC